jgi:uncharacterized protein
MHAPPEMLSVEVLAGASAVPAQAWNDLVDADDPFLEHAFLTALERSQSVGPGTGWEPRFVLAYRGARLVGAVPLYLRFDSMGEFIWDFDWAYAANRAGIPYFPKLVAAIPFTPATSHRLLVHPAETRAAVVPALLEGVRRLADDTLASSVHVLFCRQEEVDELVAAGFLARTSFQFHWTNRRPSPYLDFEDYLSGYLSRHRKQVRRERRTVGGYGLRILVAPGTELDQGDWEALDTFYRATVDGYGNVAFLRPAFFHELRVTHAQRVLAAIAYQGSQPVASTLSFVRGGRLCGRYWGTALALPFLHFELCFYRMIEHAIAERLDRFEGGAGGNQKLKRGLLPQRTHSAHWIRHRGLARAVADYVSREASAVDVEIRAQLESSPFSNRAKVHDPRA